MQAIAAQNTQSSEGSTNFISWTELGIYRTCMFVFAFSGSHFNLTLTEHGV